MTIKVRNAVLLAAVSSVWGCSSGNAPVDIGDGKTGQKLEDYAAVWEGYAEAYSFADGSDKVKLSLDALGNGTLTLGDSAPLPVATNGDIGYPPALRPGAPSPANDQIANLFPGFAYPINTATVESARIRFSANPWEIEHDWCELQTPYPSLPLGGLPPYSCLPYVSSWTVGTPTCAYDYGTGDVQVDCAKLELCVGFACSCNAQGCSVTDGSPFSGPNSYTRFDAALENAGNSLVGTMRVGGKQTAMTVRLKRISNN